MKAQTLAILLTYLFSLSVFSQISDDFSGGSLSTAWSGNAAYSLSQSAGQLNIEVNKNSPNQFFTYTLAGVTDVSANPYINLKISGEKAFTLEIKAYSSIGTTMSSVIRLPIASSQFVNYFVDLTSFTGKNQLSKIEFYVNKNAQTYEGTIFLDDLKIGSGATKFANLSGISNVVVYKGTTGHTIKITDILNASSISLSASPLITGVSASSIVAVANIGGVCTISFNASTTAGEGTITVTANGASGYANNSINFSIKVEDDIPPTIDKPADINIPLGVPYAIDITGISDGNQCLEQFLELTASSSNIDVVENLYFGFYDSMKVITTPLTLIGKSAGTTTITLTARDTDPVNNTTSKNFVVTVFENFNHPPTLIIPQNNFYKEGLHKILLSGIYDGDDSTQLLNITASSAKGMAIPTSPINYITGKDTATLYLNCSGIGKDTILITITDNGGNGTNNGNQTSVIKIPVEIIYGAQTGYKININNFATDTTAKLWKIEDIGTTQFATYVDTLGKRCLRINLKQKLDFSGLWYYFDNIPTLLDLTNAPYMSYEILAKGIDPLATMAYFVESDYETGAISDYYNSNGATLEKKIITTTGNDFISIFHDFRKPDYLNNASGEPIDISRIGKILIKYHKTDFKWPYTPIDGVIYITNIRLGDSCLNIPAVVPQCTIDPMPNKVIWANTNSITDVLTGISNGLGTTSGVTIQVLSSKPVFLPNPVAGTLTADGKLNIQYSVPSSIDSAQIIVRISCAGSTLKEMRYWVRSISDNSTLAATITIDNTIQGQRIVGFGGIEPSESVLDDFANDLGCTIIRFAVDPSFEKVNDNSDPNVIGRSGFDKSKIDFDYFRKAKAYGVTDFEAQLYSPPGWMMQSLSETWVSGAPTWASTTMKVDPIYYDEYVEYMTTITRFIYEETGITLTGFNPQNEPAFTEPYGCGILDPVNMAKVCGMLGNRMESEGFFTKIITSSQVFLQSANGYSVVAYANAAKNDMNASHIKVLASHYPVYDLASFATQYSAAKNAGLEYWVTEASTLGNDFPKIMENCKTMIAGLNNGCSAWILNDIDQSLGGNEHDASKKSGMIYNGGKSVHYHMFKNFSKFIRPASLQYKSTSSSSNISSTSFYNFEDSSFVIVLLNSSTKDPISVKIAGSAPTIGYEAYRSSFNEFCVKVNPFKDDLIALPPNSITTLRTKINKNRAPSITQVSDKYVAVNSGSTIINLTAINSGDPVLQSMTITAKSSNPSIIPNPTVSYTSPNNYGSITISPYYNLSGTVTITVKVKDNGGILYEGVDSVEMSFKVFVGSSCDIDPPVVNDVEICAYQSANLTATGGNQYYWYSSQTGGYIISTGSSFTTPIISYNTSYYVSNYNGICESTRSRVNINIVNKTIPKPIVKDTLICENKTVRLTAKGGTSYRWYNSSYSSYTIGTDSFYITPFITSTTTYYVSSYADGCESIKSSITVNKIETYSISMNNLKENIYKVCSSTTEKLSGSPAGIQFWGDLVVDGYFVPSLAEADKIYKIYYGFNDVNCHIENSKTIVVMPCSAIENHFEESITIFPNPTTGIINIDGIQNNKGIARIINSKGMIEMEMNIENLSPSIIDISLLPDGFYFLEIIISGNRSIEKISLQK